MLVVVYLYRDKSLNVKFNTSITYFIEGIIIPVVITNSCDIDKFEALGTEDICIGEELMKVYK
ncbi:TPA: hypothetical protein KQG29_003978 [Clostridioides difficile]|nr:hypothetical protein [Clostridioides difficile]